jgi:hypothetical protein
MNTPSATTGTLLKSLLSGSQIDDLLAAHLTDVWAGDSGGEDERRLGWWRYKTCNLLGD